MDGTVVAFDEAVGLGEIEADGERYPFHCTQITDGTRTIPVGTTVTFELQPKLGRWEATEITPH